RPQTVAQYFVTELQLPARFGQIADAKMDAAEIHQQSAVGLRLFIAMLAGDLERLAQQAVGSLQVAGSAHRHCKLEENRGHLAAIRIRELLAQAQRILEIRNSD